MTASVHRAPAGERGIALVVVLWTIALLAIIAGTFLQTMRTEVRMAHNLLATAQARLLAEAGINRAVLELYRPDPARRPRGDGSGAAFDSADGHVRISIQDESARVDLNKAPHELLTGLLAELGVDAAPRAELADRILDWRDADSLRRLHGAEDADYRAADLGYGAKDAPFDALEELLLLPGMTPRLYDRLAPWLTVHSAQSGIDPALAPPAVVRALPGMTAERADAYLATRDALLSAGQAPPLPDFIEPRYLTAARGLVYTLRAEAVSARGGNAAVEATIRLQRAHANAPFAILRWRETDSAGAVTTAAQGER